MPQPGTTVKLTPSTLALLALLVWGLWPAGLAEGTSLRIRETLRNDLPSRADTEQMERGYYEQLLDAGRQLGSIADAASAKSNRGNTPDAATAEDERLTTRTRDVREFVLRPNLVRDTARHVPWSTNDRGMRDRSYPTAKPSGTWRIALAGDSIGSGWGVDDTQGFEPRLEQLWDERSRAAGGPRIEILNFAVPGHGPGQRWTHFAMNGWDYQPDLVIYEATPADAGWDERRLRYRLTEGIGFDAPVYRATLAAAGIRPGLGSEGYRRLLRPLRWNLLEGVYRRAADECRARGVPSVWVLIPRVGKPIDPLEKAKLLELARNAGFNFVIDATDAYQAASDSDPARLAVGPSDFHPNAEGHALIARALDRALPQLPPFRLVPIQSGATADATTRPHDPARVSRTLDSQRGALPQ